MATKVVKEGEKNVPTCEELLSRVFPIASGGGYVRERIPASFLVGNPAQGQGGAGQYVETAKIGSINDALRFRRR